MICIAIVCAAMEEREKKEKQSKHSLTFATSQGQTSLIVSTKSDLILLLANSESMNNLRVTNFSLILGHCLKAQSNERDNHYMASENQIYSIHRTLSLVCPLLLRIFTCN